MCEPHRSTQSPGVQAAAPHRSSTRMLRHSYECAAVNSNVVHEVLASKEFAHFEAVRNVNDV